MTMYRLSIDPIPSTMTYSAGAPFIYQPLAPHPSRFLPNPESITAAIASKQKNREDTITKIMADGTTERWEAAMQYDMEIAPRTTNLRQLAEIGITLPAISDLPNLSDDEVYDTVWKIVYGLAVLGIFLSETDSLDDREFIDRMISRVLADEVSDIPPSRDMSEFIALIPPPVNCKDEDCDDDCDHKPTHPSRRDNLMPRPDRGEPVIV